VTGAEGVGVPDAGVAEPGAGFTRSSFQPPTSAGSSRRLDWVEAAKAFAIIGILLNHLVESFAPGPWFTNPDNNFPASLSTRLHTFFLPGPNAALTVVRVLGFLGDAGPGVFIFASGLGLTLATLSRNDGVLGAPFQIAPFYRRRAARLYPLYIAMHFVILTLALLVPSALTFGSPTTLVSATGFRGIPSLFFAISPSWWFVWLIIQLYIVYPILWRLAGRLGVGRFFVATFVFTLASRAIGIELSHNRYFWLTGMFFGSRLAEFTAGMCAAVWIARRPPFRAQDERGLLPIVVGAAACYLLGLGASIFLWGALVSNLLVTVGLTGLAYALWQGIRKLEPLARGVTWLGAASYAVFLLHQTPLRWTAEILRPQPVAHGIAAVLVLILSIPGAVGVERLVARIERDAAPWTAARNRALSLALGLLVLTLLLVIEPHLTPDDRLQRALCVILAVSVVLGGWLEWTARGIVPSESVLAQFLRRTALVGGFCSLFVLPAGYGYLAALVGIIMAAWTTLASRRRLDLARAWAGGLVLTVGVLLAVEAALARFAPTEVGGWGERRALAVHPTRAYGLIPNRVTRLRYNDYDYVVRTNSLGLEGPDITPARGVPNTYRLLAVGDAFTMPEGLNYEYSYPALLQTALSHCTTAEPVQVIDGGVTGYGPNEEGAEISELAPLFRPNVIVYQFYVNEWSDILIDSASRRRNIGLVRPRLGRIALLNRSQLVTHLSEDYDAAFSAIRGRPSRRQRWKLLLDYFQRGPNRLYTPDNIARMTAFLTSIRDTARSVGADLVIAFVPGAVQVSRRGDLAFVPRSGVPFSDPGTYDLDRPLAELRPLAASVGLPLLDLTDSLRRHQPQPVYFSDAWHWNAEGHRAAASALKAALAQRHDLPAGCTP
jgi:peptidoglycan/LPS O-acetylase OafA/YrhL